jgi:hypothetical protein
LFLSRDPKSCNLGGVGLGRHYMELLERERPFAVNILYAIEGAYSEQGTRGFKERRLPSSSLCIYFGVTEHIAHK